MAEAEGSDTASPEAMWRRLAERAIGAGIETLHSRSADGLIIKPLYSRAPSPPQQPWRRQGAWTIAQRVDHPDAEAANTQALLDLEGGANALVLVDAASPYGRGFGTGGDLDHVLTGIELDFIGVRLEAGPQTASRLHALARLVAARRLTSAGLDVDIGFDSIGWHARLGHAVDDDPAPLLALGAQAGLAGTIYLADGRPWHEAGAGEAQELAAVLATALAYLRRLEAQGHDLDAARRQIALLLAADADVFLGLAKFRAMRRLWARIEAAAGLEPRPVRLHAETSWRMMARRDPWTNVMRTTAATFAAGLGGADAITILPFTLPLGLPDADARRLARNAQHVLLDEAHLAVVEDPAAGAGGFEALTDGLCATAWGLFQAIEREGGIVRAIERGSLQAWIAETAQARAHDIARLTRGLIGTSRFASLTAPEAAVLDVAPCPCLKLGGLPTSRDAAPFEALRDRAEVLAATGAPCFVFLATLGPPPAYGPRATYAVNFLAAGGLSAEVALVERDIGTLIAAFIESGARIACICGADAAIAADGAALASALRTAGAGRVLRAGANVGDDAMGASVDAVVHDGCDALGVLNDLLDVLSQGPDAFH